MDQSIIDAGTESFNLPHDIVQLPSGGVFYKSKKKSIKVGYLTANDETALMGATQMSNDNIIMTLLRSKIYEHDLPALRDARPGHTKRRLLLRGLPLCA